MKKLVPLFLATAILLSSCASSQIKQNHDYIQIKPSQSITTGFDRVLEIGNKLVFLYYPTDQTAEGISFLVETYEAETGARFASFDSTDYPNYGELLRIDKELEFKEHDYRMIFESAIVYKNSGSNDKSGDLVCMRPGAVPGFENSLLGYNNDVREACQWRSKNACLWRLNFVGFWQLRNKKISLHFARKEYLQLAVFAS